MDAIVTQLQDLFEGQIDFHGQRLTENLATVLLSITSILALIVGFVRQDIYLILWIGLAGTLLTMLVVVPPWPAFNKHPEPWLGSRTALPPGGIIIGSEKAG